MSKYLIRLDDACPTIDVKKWNSVFKILDKYNIKPIVAVIPNNEDEKMLKNNYDNEFWNKVRDWQEKGYHIALHGYNHRHISKHSGIIHMNNRSEFAGVNIEIQRDKIKKAWQIFKQNKIIPNIWIAPSHTFDKNTLKVLKESTTIKIISDGIAFYPYTENNFFWIPQQLWWFVKKNKGIWTICLHPNEMNDKQIEKFDEVLRENKNNFLYDLNELYEKYRNRKRCS